MVHQPSRSTAVRPSTKPASTTSSEAGLKVYALATERHFVDHLAPIWNALPEEVRGTFYCGGGPGRPRLAYTQAVGVHGITEACGGMPKRRHRGLAMVAASGDLNRVVRASPDMRMVMFEHGCGLSYNRRQNSYAGARNRPNVDLFIFPNELSAGKQRVAHPDVRIEVLGSSPRLDPWAPGGTSRLEYEARRAGRPPCVCISFHWDCQVVPETRSALPYYRKRFTDLLDRGWEVIGHAHPRIIDHAEIAYRAAGIETVRDFAEVMDRADLYAIDNSSTLYEFAATGRPVIALNCPRYRKHVRHGLRFWSDIPGPQVDGPEDLPDVIERALTDPREYRNLRESAIKSVYPQHDGGATSRAAAMILDQLAVTEADYPSPDARWKGPSRQFVVHGPDGPWKGGPFLVFDEARRLVKKRGGDANGWSLEEIVNGESTIEVKEAHLHPAAEARMAPSGGPGADSRVSRRI